MRNLLTNFVTLLGVLALGSTAEAQTLRMMKSLDAPHYDGARTTWSPSSDIVNMFQDTLVAMDWDGKTAIPYLAKSWTVSEDGKLYTFKLRDDVTFCSGKKFTADDVVYSFKRLTSAELKAPLAWRAGETAMLQSSLMRAVVFSALTTATAFGALWLSSHPGTASMGRLLMISLGWELLVTLLVRPALLARPPSFTR